MQQATKKLGKCSSWRLNVPTATPWEPLAQCLGPAEFWTQQETRTNLVKVQSITQIIRTIVGVKIMSTSHSKSASESLWRVGFSIWLPWAFPALRALLQDRLALQSPGLQRWVGPFQKLTENTEILGLLSSFYCLFFSRPFQMCSCKIFVPQ